MRAPQTPASISAAYAELVTALMTRCHTATAVTHELSEQARMLWLDHLTELERAGLTAADPAVTAHAAQAS